MTEQIEDICSDLFYLSETDAEVRPFFGGSMQNGVRETVIKNVDAKSEKTIEEISLDSVFSRLKTIHDRSGENENVVKSVELRKLLEKNLKDLIVLRFGRIQIDIYVVGVDAEGNLAGIRTTAVET